MSLLTSSNTSGEKVRPSLFFDQFEQEKLPKDIPIHKLLNIILYANPENSNLNCVWMNDKDVKELFINNLYGADNYVKIADRVYEVVKNNDLARKSIMMNLVQIADCSEGKFFREGSQVIVVEPFYCAMEKTRAIEQVEFKLNFFDQEKNINLKQPALIHVEDLRNKVNENYLLQFLKEDQSLILDHPQGALKLKVGDMDTVDKEFAEDYWPKKTYRQVTDKTKVDFSVSENSNIVLVDKVIDDDSVEICFTIKAIRKNPDRENRSPLVNESGGWKEGVQAAPLVVDWISLFRDLHRKLNNKCILDNFKMIVSHDNHWDLEISLPEEVFLKHIIKEEETKYHIAYKVKETTTFIPNPGENVIFTLGDEETAKNMNLEIVDFQNLLPFHNLSNKMVISPKELEAALRVQKPHLVIGERHVIEIPFKAKVLLEVKSADNPRFLDCKKTWDHVEDFCWSVENGTNLTFNVKGTLPIKIVDGQEPQAVKKLNVAIDIERKDFNPEKLILDEEGIDKLLAEVLPAKFSAGDKFSNELDENTTVHFTIQTMDFAEPLEHADMGLFGKVCDSMEYKFIAKQDGQVVLKKKSEAIPYADVESITKIAGLGGLSEQFKTIIRDIMLSRNAAMNEHMSILGITPAKGLLLYGPPGTGKTTLARNLGKILGCDNNRLQMISGSEIWNKWLGNSEENVRNLFKPAHLAAASLKEKSPLYEVIIDEIDAMLSARDDSGGNDVRNSVVNQFLGELDGLKELNNILVVGLTNYKEMLDPAVLRQGRMDVHVEIGLPDVDGRREIFDIHSAKIKENDLLHKDVNVDVLIEKMKGCSGADIQGVIRKAAKYSLERLMALQVPIDELVSHKAAKITHEDFIRALEVIDGKKEDNLSHLMLYT